MLPPTSAVGDTACDSHTRDYSNGDADYDHASAAANRNAECVYGGGESCGQRRGG